MSNAQPAKVAAALARDVYALTKQPNKATAMRTLNDLYRGNLTFADDNLLTAKQVVLLVLKSLPVLVLCY
jgi:hypothetical protein